MILFNKAPVTGEELEFISDAINTGELCGDRRYSKMCQDWFENELSCFRSLLTPSCTAALELAAMLIDIRPGDEVILPSYTFVSTANAFVLRGAKLIFVDVRPDTMNINEKLIEAAISERTKAIVPVHYAGISCEMDTIMEIASKHNIYVIEDAAQGIMSTYKGKPLGSIGHLGTYSFHETKNYTSGGEGGLLIINDQGLVQRAEILREKGTDRSQFLRGMVDKYSWVDIGSSFLPSDIQAAYLWAQLKNAQKINKKRRDKWGHYYNELSFLSQKYQIELPNVPLYCEHNAHMFYVKLSDIQLRDKFIDFMKDQGIVCPFHYVPLHSSLAGKEFGEFNGEDKFTTKESERLVRLPLYYNMTIEEQNTVIKYCIEFFENGVS
ncbi:dTDP-4-amino-4,6-dideoxygalactose transaminase [Vibrio harveyi]|uniref:dTDP-4-amino-4,6-dideoxygalactose transaminase n=1 Tax=Vibrio harveyi TaxID=669 RepID=UPI0023804395|nr:dTDP-4-amino-4,6-dideoxygalactose transaminase [Vibrio harveyi]